MGIGSIVLAAGVLVVWRSTERETRASVVEAGRATEEPVQAGALAVLEAPAGPEPRAECAEPEVQPPFDPSRVEHAPVVVNEQAPYLFQPLVPFENRIIVDALGQDFKVIFPVITSCKRLGISELRRESAIDVLLDGERKWKKLCADAGSAEKVAVSELDTLRAQRRDDLALVMGYADADRLLAEIQPNLGF
jgi:hypothetical protein